MPCLVANQQDNVLVHHGIRGQRWGIRRFQNKDGSYTDVGKRRQRKIPKNVNKMTDEELQRAINRKRSENTYKELVSNQKQIQTGKKKLTRRLEKIGNTAAIGASAVALYAAFRGLKRNSSKEYVAKYKDLTEKAIAIDAAAAMVLKNTSRSLGKKEKKK